MTHEDYSSSALAIRDDLVTGHRRMLERLTVPGTWWTGAERRAIAEHARLARDCALCSERKSALTPNSVPGEHDGPATLEPAIVDAIHRIVSDPGRLTRSGYEALISSGVLDPERYVELVSVTVSMNALDVFARAIGVEPRTLPEPIPGAPTRNRPASARVEDAWVPQIPAGGDGGDDWRALYGDREFVAQIGRALSLVPAEVERLNETSALHYMRLDHVIDPSYSEPGRGLDRLQMELVASRVSAINECFY